MRVSLSWVSPISDGHSRVSPANLGRFTVIVGAERGQLCTDLVMSSTLYFSDIPGDARWQ